MAWKNKVMSKAVKPATITERTTLMTQLLTLEDVEAPGINHFDEMRRNIFGALAILTPKDKPTDETVTRIALDAVANYAARLSDKEWETLKNNAGSEVIYQSLHEQGDLKKAIEEHIKGPALPGR